MIHPTDARLLAGLADALKDTVLPDLARGTAARKQLQAAIEILRRMAFASPGSGEALAVDNEDMARVLGKVRAVMADASPSPRPPPIEGEGGRKALPLDGGGLGEGDDPAATNLALQAQLSDLQDGLNQLPASQRTQIETLLADLYTRMTDRALALIPPPAPRTPRRGA